MMREINIGKIISTKRKEKGITQDMLAEYIGVTKASVSKWETSQSYPDITLLPQLATYFNISVDELIGYQPQMTKEEISKTFRRLAAEFSTRPFHEVHAECREMIRKYYTCFPLLMQMAVLFINHYMLEKGKEKKQALLQEIIDLCDRIKRESEDVWLSKQANSIEALSHLLLNQPLEALELLDESMKPTINDYSMLARAYQMTGNIEKAITVMQVNIFQHLRGLLGPAQAYLLLIAGEPEKFEQALERFQQISNIFEMEKLDPNSLCLLYLTAAQGYVLQNNLENALKMLEKYSYISTTALLPYKLTGDSFFDRLDDWLKEYDFEAHRDEKTIKASILQSVAENPAFFPLHDEPKFQSIVNKLKLYVEGN